MTDPSGPPLGAAALWYAKHGKYVFPLHNPIFDNTGNCTGCTCEEYRRSDKYRQSLAEQGRKHEFDPNFKCPQPGKCPRVGWSQKSTIDEATIRKWWGKPWRNVDVETGQFVWNLPNIGIDAGKSGLLFFDKDLYKESYAGDSVATPGNTVESRTGGGGLHDWYQMPAGKAYGNATGDLPEGIDVRGAGGYIVAPPSLHKSGKRYEFVAGHSPADIDPLPLPQFLIHILEAAQGSRDAVPVNFTAGIPAIPDLAQWPLSSETIELIGDGHPAGADRSSYDQKVITALVYAGATDDDIRAVFSHFAIGAKYEERGEKYLAHSIGKARAWLLDHPPEPPAPIELLNQARQWVRSPQCLDHLRASGIRRVADLIPILDALVELAQVRRTMRVAVTVRDLADACAISKSSAGRRLSKLGDSCLLIAEPNQFGTLIDLSLLCDHVDLSGTLYKKCESVPLRSTSDIDFFADHRIDDAFQSYPYSYAIKRQLSPTVLMQSLGASGLLLWDALLDGGTVAELAQVTGLTVAAIRSTLKKFAQAGLLVIWQEGRAKEYELHPNAWDRLEERREYMVTAGLGQLRAARNASDRATFAQRKLQGRMPLDPREKAKLQLRRDKADTKAAAHYDQLIAMGINPYMKVRPPRPPRPYMKFDPGEEWVSIHRPIVEMWDDLAPLSFAERYRMMGFAGYEHRDIDVARRMAVKVGRGPRYFVGVGQQEAVAA